ncbi:UNVERIFIED_CONTAM: hypothetical protein GTU68_065056 [Idotea baltica]|nr:hypothetical protein [Idotea baltica]
MAIFVKSFQIIMKLQKK